MSNTDDPAMLAALRAHKHRHRVPHVCRPDARVLAAAAMLLRKEGRG